MIKCVSETCDYYNAHKDCSAICEKQGFKKILSNADRIRAMSDEELAEYIFDLGNGSEYCYGHCVFQNNCTTRGLDNDTCIKGVIDWLQQPAETEGTE